jgi:hypothetical protein
MRAADHDVGPLACALRRSAALLLTAVLGACAGTPFHYRSSTEIPEGPGLLTGDRGAFVLSGAQRSTQHAAAAATAPNADFDEFDAYRAFRRAKSERSLDYREFLEWLEWKRYREWKGERERKTQ